MKTSVNIRVNTSETIRKIEQFISTLHKEGLIKIADRIENIYYNRIIWDKMVLNLFNELKSLFEANILKGESNSIAQELMSLVQPHATKLNYDYYRTAKDIANQLASVGYQDWAIKIKDAIASGSTGTEIIMALRWNIKKIKESNLEIPLAIKNLIEEFLVYVEEVLK